MNKLCYILFFLTFSANGFAQSADTIYYKGDLQTRVKTPATFDFYSIGSCNDNCLLTYYRSNHTEFGKFPAHRNRREGEGVFYHENGEISRKGNFRKDKPIGTHDYFDVTAIYVRSEIYNRSGKIIAEYYKTASGKKVYTVCNELSSFGQSRNETKAFMQMGVFIDENLVRTEISKELDEAVVTVAFLIAPDGSLEEVEIVQSVHTKLNAEVLSVMKKMPKWRPAKFKRKAVYSEFSITVNF
ncbi:MAG: TonB family protein [Crocinitomix sp.]